MKVLNVVFTASDWNPNPWSLGTVILHGACGFYNISQQNVLSCDLIRIWSLPGTNLFEKTIVFTAPVTGCRRTKWNGTERSIIEFDTGKSEWDDSGSQDRPACNRNGWVITEEAA